MRSNYENLARFAGNCNAIEACVFKSPDEIRLLHFREYPHWHILLSGKHIGIHRPDERVCNWTARTLTSDGLYRQKCLGPGLDLGKGIISYKTAIARAFEWFETGEVRSLSAPAKNRGRVHELSVCPFGPIYTVGHAMRDYLDWSKIARSPGSHYNNLTMMNYHLVPSISSIPIEAFRGKDLQKLAVRVLERPPKRGFEQLSPKVSVESLLPDEVRRRKRTFNTLVTILRVVFKYAWENGRLESERSWKCLNRVSVIHSPRTTFLTRGEVRRLIDACPTALRRLVLAGLYTGCRVGELGALRVRDVGSDGFGVTIRAFKRGPTRLVFLPDEGMAFFFKCCEGKNPDDFVLLSAKHKPWRRQHTLHFRTAVAKAGLPKDFVFHGLRHTYASDLLRSGASLDTVAKQFGHANTLTVMNTYGHLAEHLRESQVRDCFTPISVENQHLVNDRRQQFDELRQRGTDENWRSYASFDDETSLPRNSVARPHPLVLKTFKRIPGKH